GGAARARRALSRSTTSPISSSSRSTARSSSTAMIASSGSSRSLSIPRRRWLRLPRTSSTARMCRSWSAISPRGTHTISPAASSVLIERSADFAARYRAKIGSLDAPGLRAALDEADDLGQELSRLQVYTFLRQSLDATDVEANDLTTTGRDRGADIENDLLF